MPAVCTKYFGTVEFQKESVFDFPVGLPAFEDEKRFIPIEVPASSPLVFLQSLATPDLCFLAFPILVVDRDYRMAISPEDLAVLKLEEGREPRIGDDLLVLALLCLHDGNSVTANLMAPLVVNLLTRTGVQAIRHDAAYSHQHPVSDLTQVESC